MLCVLPLWVTNTVCLVLLACSCLVTIMGVLEDAGFIGPLVRHPYPLRSRCHRRGFRWGSFGKELYGGDNLIHGTLHITHPMGRVGVQLLTVSFDGNLDDIALGSEPDSALVVCQPFELAFVEVRVHTNPLSVKNQP